MCHAFDFDPSKKFIIKIILNLFLVGAVSRKLGAPDSANNTYSYGVNVLKMDLINFARGMIFIA